MKTLVTYSTKTGNTKKVAESIAKAIENAEIKDIAEVSNLDYNLIIVGTWIDKGTADAKALNFIKTIKNKNTAFFFTLGAYPDSQHALDCVENITKLFTENSNKVLGHFLCQGIKRWADASLHPDESDLNNAYTYFKDLIAKL